MSGSSSSLETAKSDSQRTLDFRTGTLLVIANMIGVGAFTTSGFFLGDVRSPWAVMAGWVVGGLMALCGAFAYAEIGAALPQNGGEYYFLTRIYHPAFGFSAALASFFVGSAAPLASFGLVFGAYLQRDFLPNVPAPVSGMVLLIVTSAIHIWHLGFGHRFQNWATVGKLLLILGLISAGIVFAAVRGANDLPVENFRSITAADWQAINTMSFAGGLIFVSFAYAGWNAVGYVAGEMQSPEKTIPRTLLTATLIVTVLYCGLNWAFLISVPGPILTRSLENKERIAGLAGEYLLGASGGKAISFLIIAGLIATAGALTYTGARVTEALGNRYPALGILAARRPGGGPIVAILLQLIVAACLLVSASVDKLMTYAGFTLILFNMAVVAGVFVLRIREPNLPRPWKMWGYPITPILFLALQLWIVWNMLAGPMNRTGSGLVALFGFGTVLIGIGLYYVVRLGGERRELS